MDQVRISMPKIEGTFLPPSPKATGIKTQKKRAQNPHSKTLAQENLQIWKYWTVCKPLFQQWWEKSSLEALANSTPTKTTLARGPHSRLRMGYQHTAHRLKPSQQNKGWCTYSRSEDGRTCTFFQHRSGCSLPSSNNNLYNDSLNPHTQLLKQSSNQGKEDATYNR